MVFFKDIDPQFVKKNGGQADDQQKYHETKMIIWWIASTNWIKFSRLAQKKDFDKKQNPHPLKLNGCVLV